MVKYLGYADTFAKIYPFKRKFYTHTGACLTDKPCLPSYTGAVVYGITLGGQLFVKVDTRL